MAVQAQYPANAFSPDFRARVRNNVLEELQMLQDRNHGSLLAAYTHLGRQVLNNGTVFSDPQSELTCNASASRKRVREEAPVMPQPDASFAMQQLVHYPNMMVAPAKSGAVETVAPAGNQLSGHQIRLLDSAAASTSGRPPVAATACLLAQDLVSHLYHQNIEIDALVRVQSERLRSGLEEARKRHCRTLLSVLEQRMAKRLKEKELELENASRRNAELEEKVRQLSAESQIWFNVAKNNEAIVSSLRASLEQNLLQNNVSGGGVAGALVAEEGFWDSEASPAAVFPADDAGSCCFEDGERERREAEALRARRACKACGERDVCVLLLPCRHLCLCRDCESQVDTCPVCHAVKNTSLQVFIS